MISELAIIDNSAKIGKNVEIGPFTIVGPDVVIGDDCKISSHVVLKGPTRMGCNNQIFQFASIGEECQDTKYAGEPTTLEIGDNNIFREGCTVHRGTSQDLGYTKVGNDNLFMVNTHIAHDCIVGNHVVFSNNASIAGHVRVDDYASLGGFVGVHQFVKIGAHSFIAGGSIVVKDVAPFVMVSGHAPSHTHGLNSVGLTRRGFSDVKISALKKAYRIIFRDSTTVNDAVEKLNPLIEKFPEILLMKDFLEESSRGITR